MTQFAKRMDRVSGSVVREILKLTADPSIIAFGGGSPAAESFPVDTIREIINQQLDDNPNRVLQYGTTEGWPELRQAYIDHILKPKGVEAGIENVITLTGATQGIQMLIEVLVDPGDTVFVESPTFLTTLAVFNKFYANRVEIATDEFGMIPEDLEAKAKLHHPKVLYCIPTFQNPTGRTLTLERRKRIAELAAEYNFIVIEDDPYRDLRYKGEELPPIKSFDKTGHVALVDSFSKIIAPGLRVGAVTASPKIIEKLVVAKQGADTHTTNLAQCICAEFLNRGLLPDHLKKIRPMYKERMETMIRCIDEYFPAGTKRTDPDGGLFIWVDLPGDPDLKKLLAKATGEYKVAFIPGTPFFLNADDGNKSIRLNFSAASVENIQIGMERLGKLFCEDI